MSSFLDRINLLKQEAEQKEKNNLEITKEGDKIIVKQKSETENIKN